jgi:hypothetical protein
VQGQQHEEREVTLPLSNRTIFLSLSAAHNYANNASGSIMSLFSVIAFPPLQALKILRNILDMPISMKGLNIPTTNISGYFCFFLPDLPNQRRLILNMG